MSADRLAEIRARAEAATPGPWTLGPCSHGGQILQRGDDSSRETRHPQTYLQIVPDSDAEFIAHARTDIPYLLGRIEHLEHLRDDAEMRDDDYRDFRAGQL